MNILMKKINIYLVLIFTFILNPVFAAQTITGGEKVAITIKGVPSVEQTSINGDYIVSDSGLLFMPMIEGGIQAAGSSSSTVARRIEAAYKNANIYVNPRITIVTVRDEAAATTISRKFVTVAGQVKRPGPVQYSEGLTIYDAVAAAGDSTAFGAMNRVELLRNGKKHIYNLRSTAHRMLRVYPNDTVTVPDKNLIGQ